MDVSQERKGGEMMPNETKSEKKSPEEPMKSFREKMLATSKKAMKSEKVCPEELLKEHRGRLFSNLRPRNLLDDRIAAYEDAKAELRQLKSLIDSRLDLTRAQEQRRKDLEDELMDLCGELRGAAGWYGEQAERITNLLNASAEADIARGPER